MFQIHERSPEYSLSAGRFVARAKAHDEFMTYSNSQRTHDSAGNAMGVPLPHRFTTHDGRTVDSTGAFLVGELERLDLALHEPLAAVSWGRDIDLREDVTLPTKLAALPLPPMRPVAAWAAMVLGMGRLGSGRPRTKSRESAWTLPKSRTRCSFGAWKSSIRFQSSKVRRVWGGPLTSRSMKGCS